MTKDVGHPFAVITPTEAGRSPTEDCKNETSSGGVAGPHNNGIDDAPVGAAYLADAEGFAYVDQETLDSPESKDKRRAKASWLDKQVHHKEEEVQLTRLQIFVRSGIFSALTSTMICVNGVLIGVETDWGDGSTAWVALEWFFLIFYALELIVRLGADGCKVLRTDGWIQFDFFVCVIALADVCIIGPMMKESGANGEAKQVAMVLRILRLMKLTRIIRLLRFFKELWLLVASFGSAFKTLAWTFVLLLMVLYVFAILFVKLLGKEVDRDCIKEWFGTMGGAMFTLFQIMTLESWAEIAREVWATDRWFMTFMILIFIMICSFAIMNTVLAVIVEHTLGEAMEQRDDIIRKAQEELQRAAKDLLDIFRNADEDHSGMLSKDEFVLALNNESTRRLLQEMDLGEDFGCLDPEEIGALFDTIDVDDSHGLTPQEFVDGMMQMRGPARARRLFEMHCDLQKKDRLTKEEVKSMNTKVSELYDLVSALSKRMEAPGCFPSQMSSHAASLGTLRAIQALEEKVDKHNQALHKRLDQLFAALSVGETHNDE
jgi:voltage-gated sodium channel